MIQEVYNFNTDSGSLNQCMLPNFKKTPISNKLYNLKYTKFSAKLQWVIVITLVKFNNRSVPREFGKLTKDKKVAEEISQPSRFSTGSR